MTSVDELALHIAQGDISRMLEDQRLLREEGVDSPRMAAEGVIRNTPRLRVILLRRYRRHWVEYRQALRDGDRGECVVIERRIDSFGAQLVLGVDRDEFIRRMSEI